MSARSSGFILREALRDHPLEVLSLGAAERSGNSGSPTRLSSARVILSIQARVRRWVALSCAVGSPRMIRSLSQLRKVRHVLRHSSKRVSVEKRGLPSSRLGSGSFVAKSGILSIFSPWFRGDKGDFRTI
jgi:hypothetical protein